MTLREKLEIEHPECIGDIWYGGCKDCPHTYGYCTKEDVMCDTKTCTDDICRRCWDRKYEGELTPQEKKIEELKHGLYCKNIELKHCIDENTIHEYNVRSIESHIENTTPYCIRPWDFSKDVNRAVDELLSSRNRWRAAFSCLLGITLGILWGLLA